MIAFNGIEYPTRTFSVHSEEGGEDVIQIATDSLHDVLIDEDGEPVSTLAENLDGFIYYYVPDLILDNDPEDICENHLDIKFTFIEELT